MESLHAVLAPHFIDVRVDLGVVLDQALQVLSLLLELSLRHAQPIIPVEEGALRIELVEDARCLFEELLHNLGVVQREGGETGIFFGGDRR